MWFLQIDTLLLMLLGCVLASLAIHISKKFGKQPLILHLMPILDLSLVLYVSEKLTVFYIGYVLLTYCFLLFLRRVKKGRKFCFALLCLGCCVPLFYSRAAEFWTLLPTYGLIMIGIAYNMLKAVDALYYEYYSGVKIPFSIYANYILFFPVITAGPVFRYRDFEKVWQKPCTLDLPRLTHAVKRIIRGLFKKVVLSALAVALLGYLTGMQPHWYLSAVIPAVSWCVLFFDMSGYADIAIGMGGIMGITVPENFKKPLQSASFTQFWRNWHVTVSDWIREHVFVLVSGKKLNKLQSAAIGFIVMMIMSLWHNFTTLFILDGIILGGIIAVENLCGITTVNKRKSKKSYYLFRCFLTNYMFALNTMLFTLSTTEIKAVVRGFLVF